MFIPIHKSGESIIWHLICRNDGRFCSFREAKQYKHCTSAPGNNSVRFDDLETSRHFVGGHSSISDLKKKTFRSIFKWSQRASRVDIIR